LYKFDEVDGRFRVHLVITTRKRFQLGQQQANAHVDALFNHLAPAAAPSLRQRLNMAFPALKSTCDVEGASCHRPNIAVGDEEPTQNLTIEGCQQARQMLP
jgi:hypothetical protein